MTQETVLNAAQAKQIKKQYDLHIKCEAPMLLDPIVLDKGAYLKGLSIHPGVLRPMSSRSLASFLHRQRNMIRGKTVIDMGSGCGIQGIVAALNGASRVILSDVTEEACANTSANVSQFQLDAKCDVRRGDLFENVPESAEVVIFAQPYFPGSPDSRHPFTYGMLDEGELIHRFLEQAKSRAEERILMCYLDLAGDVNNPLIQAPKHGYRVTEHGPISLNTGEQRGRFWVHELTVA